MRGSSFAQRNVMDAATVAKLGIAAMVAGKEKVVTGWGNRISVFGLRFTPRWLVRLTIRKMFQEYSR